MTKFKVNDIVKIKKKIYNLDLYYQYGQKHYRKFHTDEIGKIFQIVPEYPRVDNINVKFMMIKLWIYRKNAYPFVAYCKQEELALANKEECKKYEENEEIYEAKITAEKL